MGFSREHGRTREVTPPPGLFYCGVRAGCPRLSIEGRPREMISESFGPMTPIELRAWTIERSDRAIAGAQTPTPTDFSAKLLAIPTESG